MHLVSTLHAKSCGNYSITETLPSGEKEVRELPEVNKSGVLSAGFILIILLLIFSFQCYQRVISEYQRSV